MKNIASVLLVAAYLAAPICFAKDAPKTNPFRETLASVPAAEMPAQAADLVLHAKNRDRAATTVDVVKAAVGINPAAAPAIVAAISKAVPNMASVAAGTAAAEQPKQAAAIAKAAAAAAPSNVRKIVTSVCRAVPSEYRNVAVAVSEVAPGAGKEILEGIAAAFPDMKPSIEQALAVYGGNVPSVADVLDQAAKLVQGQNAPGAMPLQSASRASTPAVLLTTPSTAANPGRPIRGPAVGGPPYVPLPSTPTNVTSGTSGEVPTGGRNYAAP